MHRSIPLELLLAPARSEVQERAEVPGGQVQRGKETFVSRFASRKGGSPPAPAPAHSRILLGDRDDGSETTLP